jgi:hypothetical protein
MTRMTPVKLDTGLSRFAIPANFLQASEPVAPELETSLRKPHGKYRHGIDSTSKIGERTIQGISQ